MALLVGLDVGTSSAKAVVFTDQGEVVGEGRARTPWITTSYGVEVAAEELLNAATEALGSALDATPGATSATAVGITSIGESGVLVDRDGTPVAPVIAWHDSRDHEEVEALRRDIARDTFAATTGKPLRGQWAITKHRWLLRHVPSVAAAVRRFNIAEWVVRGLGGDEVTELALACRTGWLDLSRRDWWPEGLAWSGATPDLMPPLVEAGMPVGQVTRADIHPRLRGAVLTVVGHDHQAAAVGVGATAEGDEVDSCGTAEAIVRTIPAYLKGEQVRDLAHAGITTDWSIQPGRWSLLAGTEGGLAMQRVLNAIGVDQGGFTALDAVALDAPQGRVRVEGIGTEAVHLRNLLDGVTPGEVWRAVVEAATEEVTKLHNSMTEIVGEHQDIIVTGGWSRSAALMAAKRRRLGTLRLSAVQEAGARGAAIYAGRAAGVLTSNGVFPDPNVRLSEPATP
ncbi:MAG TPA: FGGY family carbohydrate kinase [Propionibacteriaceae bacterium]|nr:FGGY family carbohydrate kinase [Propionibacteriaceae bacterium]